MTSTFSDVSIEARFCLARGEKFSLDVDLKLPGRGITAIFGRSGSGKTTLLRCIAGLERADRGHLSVKGETWQGGDVFLPTHRRPLGYVFQEASLFPHLNTQGNLAYAMKRAAPLPADEYQRILDVMAIDGLLQRYPQQLSGGERQRVAIARALLIQPRLLLMDEPLASLDDERKREIFPYLEKLHTDFDLPVLYVSHAVDEVARLADHALVLENGRALAHGEFTEVFSRLDLSSRFGDDTGVVLQGKVVEKDQRWHLMRVAFAGSELWVRDGGDAIGQAVRVRILARDISLALSSHDDSSILNRLSVEVVDITDDEDEAMALIRLKAGEAFLIARLTQRSVDHLALTVGKCLWAQIKSAALVR